jgi:TetR/AcrR family transcriptional regulator, cholesterol catabolism regulator
MTETAVKPARAVRADNRLQGLLDAAARLFAERGYAATSTRDIALAADMLPGSLYYHFASKEQMLVAVYEAGVSELAAAVRGAIGREALPWSRLEAACRAHLETVLKHSDYAQVLIRVLPQDVPVVAERLGTLRAGYEAVWRELVAALPLPAGSDRRALRLMLLGSLNWARFWFDLQGRDSPRVLARKFVGMLKEAQEHG